MSFRRVEPADLDRVCALEAASYPPDEAASRERLEQRIASAADCFLVCEQEGELRGFVCGTRSAEATLTDDSMATHDSLGTSLCIHSVVVAAAARRQGVGSQLLAAYRAHVQSALPGVERVLLICKEHLLGFYGEAGFSLVGPSPVVHGQDPWFELRLELSNSRLRD